MNKLDRARRGWIDIVVIGFATTVAMWAIAYVCRIPPAWMPDEGLLALLLLSIVGGGFFGARLTGRGFSVGPPAGALIAGLNLLILGSLLTGEEPNQIVPSALWWLPGSILAGVVLATLGAWLGSLQKPLGISQTNWTTHLARTAATATFLLLIVGGIVTSQRAGLAVVDWPNSFGYNMFLYPLARMSGGIFYEHAHRLIGSLVGLTVLVLAIHLQRTEERRWLRRLALLTLLAVVMQGILGGLRVTGSFTMSQSPDETSPNLLLALIHGVFGQLVFGLLVGIAVFTSTTWKSGPPPVARSGLASEQRNATLLIAIIVVQLLLGAIQRHFAGGLILHISLAMVVFLFGAAIGVRALTSPPDPSIHRQIGKAILIGLAIQLLLGIGAAVSLGLDRDAATPATISVLLRTTHQAVGALLLGLATMLRLWSARLFTETGS